MNSFGSLFRITTFGESHGPAIGGVIDGMPPYFQIDREAIKTAMDRRRPACSRLVSKRNETDEIEFLSGLKDNITLGSPIAFIIRNNDSHSKDYAALQHAFRPNHADYTYLKKYGIRDANGGGRASARETACRVVAGALAAQVLATKGIEIRAYISGIGDIQLENPYCFPSYDEIYTASEVRCPDSALATDMKQLIEKCIANGDSVGARVSCVIRGVPCGIGAPIYDKLQASLAAAMMSINAAKGFEYGLGFNAAKTLGSQTIDSFILANDNPLTLHTVTNHSGGIQGGISNGEDITMSVAFKPTPSIAHEMDTITDQGEPTKISIKGRHDPCVGIRAVPVVEAMAAITILDALLQYHSPADFSNLI